MKKAIVRNFTHGLLNDGRRQGISIFAHDNVNMPLNQKKNTNPNRFKKY